MIFIEEEKNLVLTTQNLYDICDFATQAAFDDGFMNSFIFERALFVFAAIYLYEDRHDELTELAAQNMNEAYYTILQDGLLDQMSEDYPKELDTLGTIGQAWFDDYRTYAHSARGLLNSLQVFTGDMVRNAAAQLGTTVQNEGIQELLETAEEWGMGRNIGEVDPESVFEE